MAVGIVSYGTYVPLYRMGPGTNGWTIPRERSVANFDEDSITMGVAAARDCRSNFSRENIGGLYFATTTPPYPQKSNATIVAAAADLPTDIFTSDFANSPRAGTDALKSAIHAVNCGAVRQLSVVASDLRAPQARSELETIFGDGAAAFLIGDSNIVAEFEDCASISYDILDVWRAEGDSFLRTWEDRFVVEEGYLKVLPQCVSNLMNKRNWQAKDFDKVVLYAPDARRHQEIVRKLGFDLKSQVQDPMFNSLGNTGTPFALMMLAAALDEAKAGDRILVANYGDGADAFSFKVTDKIEAVRKNRRALKTYLNSKKRLSDYETYLTWRGLLDRAPPVRRPPFRTPSPVAMLREETKNIRFHGTKCKQCGYPQYPPQRVCTRCHSRDNFEVYPFADKRGELFTYTLEYMAATLDPPAVVSVVNFEGGGRSFMLMTDREVDRIQIGIPVEMTFRKLFTAGGIHNYYWKCMPVRDGGANKV